MGVQGLPGVKGEQGLPGLQGFRGESGPKGERGQSWANAEPQQDQRSSQWSPGVDGIEMCKLFFQDNGSFSFVNNFCQNLVGHLI